MAVSVVTDEHGCNNKLREAKYAFLHICPGHSMTSLDLPLSCVNV